MAVISITISKSTTQVVAGIPRTITLTTSIPATIFYTLDGTTPTLSSSIATGPIILPTDVQTVVLQAFATDGVTTCPIISESFGSSTVGNRQPHDTVSGLNDVTKGATYPFGSQDPGGPGIYGNTGGVTVDSPSIAGTPDGYDGTATGTPSNETDVPIDELDIIFSETNAIGERGAGIGTLPAEVFVRIPGPVQESVIPSEGSNNTSSPVFNPKSLVIFQDTREPPFDPEKPMVNHNSFDLESLEFTRHGNLLNTTADEGLVPMGSVLKSHFNPVDNTITYYYRDGQTNRWIISTTPFIAKNPEVSNLSKIVFGRERGVGKIFQWVPFKYRTLW